MLVSYPLSVTFIDYPDPEDIAVIVYFMGCEQNCKNCHNPLFRDISNTIGTDDIPLNYLLFMIKDSCIRNQTNKIVFSGGDPLHPNNIKNVKFLLEELCKEYNIAIYTSYDKDYIVKNDVSGFTFIKSGIFIQDQYQLPEKTDNFIKFASKNQKLYNSKLELISDNGIYFF
jgi:anaerobic ribonucleoside-triphosphate reductase activating protein